MNAKQKRVKVSSLLLEQDNPRNIQLEIGGYYKNLNNIDEIQYMNIIYLIYKHDINDLIIKISSDINRTISMLSIDRISVYYDEAKLAYIVGEGNRRVTAIKLLTDASLLNDVENFVLNKFSQEHIEKDEIFKKFISKVSSLKVTIKSCNESCNDQLYALNNIEVAVFGSKEEIDVVARIMHKDGKKDWSSIAKHMDSHRLIYNVLNNEDKSMETVIKRAAQKLAGSNVKENNKEFKDIKKDLRESVKLISFYMYFDKVDNFINNKSNSIFKLNIYDKFLPICETLANQLNQNYKIKVVTEVCDGEIDYKLQYDKTIFNESELSESILEMIECILENKHSNTMFSTKNKFLEWLKITKYNGNKFNFNNLLKKIDDSESKVELSLKSTYVTEYLLKDETKNIVLTDYIDKVANCKGEDVDFDYVIIKVNGVERTTIEVSLEVGRLDVEYVYSDHYNSDKKTLHIDVKEKNQQRRESYNNKSEFNNISRKLFKHQISSVNFSMLDTLNVELLKELDDIDTSRFMHVTSSALRGLLETGLKPILSKLNSKKLVVLEATFTDLIISSPDNLTSTISQIIDYSIENLRTKKNRELVAKYYQCNSDDIKNVFTHLSSNVSEHNKKTTFINRIQLSTHASGTYNLEQIRIDANTVLYLLYFLNYLMTDISNI